MGLEPIVDEILKKGKEQSDAILQEAEKEANEILEKAESDAAKLRAEKEEAVRMEVEQLKKQEVSSAHLQMKRALLNARQGLLEEVQNNVAERIASMPSEKNEKFLDALLKKHAEPGSKIYSNEKDRTIVEKISGSPYAGKIQCIGGVVIESSDGSVQYDYTYDTLLKDLSERSLKQISDILSG
ncbi:V-type ATP synthase subunit E [Methanosarcinales archaeon ex4572_44]|nr:MAG: V-type ATP synthase subunit E [Methanosarcinales archaeon ex4484_138]PHP45436.1 MAG: V-type ATP synthase subunit E [Methanosarcinales archaeon ex4572_44]RLG27453.1 MAG: V-type ATP synthase subunit E [Methanosarcinales archaeon]HHI30150.1 V-type ATP synthase subunit E [Candidatus Methanoperedenaceae archaeon]